MLKNTVDDAPPREGLPDDDELLRESEAAEMLSVAPRTLTQWRWEGRGPTYVRVGSRAIRYRRGDVRRYRDAGTVTPQAS